MILFTETNKVGESHLALNSAMLEILNNVSDKSEVLVYGEERHLNFLKTKLRGNKKIKTEKIIVFEGSYLIWPIKILFEFYNLLAIFRKAKKCKVNLIFFSSIFPLSHASFLVIRLFFKKVYVLIGLHGELKMLKSNSIKDRFLSFFVKVNLRNLNDGNTFFVVYSDFIEINLVKLIPETKNRVISIDHPYQYTSNFQNFKLSKPIKIASIGIAAKVKNTHFIFELANMLKEQVINKLVVFQILGKSINDIIPYKNSYVEFERNNKMIEIDKYQDQIRGVDFFIFFYDNNLYSLSPSGVFFEALEFEKPIIALKNDMFVYYFKRFGDIGYLCDNLTEMAQIIFNILYEFDLKKYEIQMENIRKAKREMDIISVSTTFTKKVINLIN